MQLTVDATVSLRSVELTDSATLFSRVDRDRAYLGRWLTWVSGVRSEADMRNALQSLVDRESRGGVGLVILENDKPRGIVGMDFYGPSNDTGDLNYWLFENAQGRGLATRSAASLIDHVFSTTTLNRLTLRAADANPRSCAVAERLGFVREGVLREAEKHPDGYVDLVVYSLLRRDLRGGSVARRIASGCS